ncbi:hypothetical protein QQS21_006799 [Conoideocrella luteorostrata]|uniref:Zn(2)-C6 fungal-type domain-containing protein n=1 Tax=Conoideocrella luteorostrata TaxID=1105319 RepID=A0AAJ0CPL8_9HYPO|nr:hypothetical protein QQS21_006799 [Conoideocrella luteorostrata]
MPTTLRRSCDSCARAKHRCDLQVPRCSRCLRRKVACVYANQPSSALRDFSDITTVAPYDHGMSDTHTSTTLTATTESAVPIRLFETVDASLDPFDSYPTTKIPRTHVQRLIYHFLNSVAFQYYPLDMNKQSNPFIVTWWPLALHDPALFHVSLQTASLDIELHAQKGFPISTILMVDSVAHVRRKIEESPSCIEDQTMNAVVTLAAIEHGKGNLEASKAHIHGVKKMASIRGGLHEVKRSSALTARMVSWVCLLVTCWPQFDIMDDNGMGNGVEPIVQWELATAEQDALDPELDSFDIDPAIRDITARLRIIFHRPCLSGTDLHDLTSFVIHKLLLLPPFPAPQSIGSIMSEIIRFSLVLHLLIVHGTAFYSHTHLATSVLVRLKGQLQNLRANQDSWTSLHVWTISICMATSIEAAERAFFVEEARLCSLALGLTEWDHVVSHLKRILWMKTTMDEPFWSEWQEILPVVSPLQ